METKTKKFCIRTTMMLNSIPDYWTRIPGIGTDEKYLA